MAWRVAQEPELTQKNPKEQVREPKPLGDSFSANLVQIKRVYETYVRKPLIISSPGWARTNDPLINSQVL